MKKVQLPEHISLTPASTYRVRYKKSNKYPIPFDKTYLTLDEAIQGKKEYLAKNDLGLLERQQQKSIGFSDFCDYLLNWYRNKPKKSSYNTLSNYKKKMNVLKLEFGNDDLKEITTHRIEMYLMRESKRNKISNGSKKGDIISAHTVHHEYTMLRLIFNKAKVWGFIDENPIIGVEEPEYQQKEIVVPDYEELPIIEDKINRADVKDKVKYLLALYTGMRREEVCGLHLEDIDREGKSVYIQRAIAQNDLTKEYEETKTKSTRSVRVLPLPSRFFKAFDEYLEWRKVFIQTLKVKTNGEYKEIPNLFLNKDGDFSRPENLSKRWKRFAKEVGINLTFHGLRHYFITNQLNYNDKVSERDVQEMAGHSNIKTTQRYNHPSKKKINQNAMEIFEHFTREELYKNGNESLTIPINHVVSIILGDSNYTKESDLKITLEEISSDRVDYLNISNVIGSCRDYLLANYPSLLRMNKYKFTKYDEKEILRNIISEFGNEFIIEKPKEYELSK